MLENTNIWTTGQMNLYVNNEPATAYITKEAVNHAYELLREKLSDDGKIPIGIDHLPEETINNNPVLAKLNLLDVGYISKVELVDDTIRIVDAELTNPLIKKLYEDGELEMVSIVATSNAEPCTKGLYDYIINTTDINRVDIVEKGACKVCKIPEPLPENDGVVYARYSITAEEDTDTMAEEETVTIESITELINAAIEPLVARIDALEKQLNEEDQEEEEGDEEVTEEVEASEPTDTETEESEEEEEEEVEETVEDDVEARLAQVQLEAATAKVDLAISAGKILPRQKEAMVKLACADSIAFDELMKNTEKIVPLDEKLSLHAGDSETENENVEELTDEQKLMNKVLEHYKK